jgi:hypothetical protein
MRNALKLGAVAFLVLACASCSGGGDSSRATFSCAYMPGTVTGNNSCNGIGCDVQNRERIADGNQGTYAEIGAGTGQITATIKDVSSTFAAGSQAGVLVTLSGGATPGSLTLNTYQGGAPRETRAGSALTVTPTNGASPAEQFLSFPTTLAFDTLEIAVSAQAGQIFRFHEFCGDS